MLNKYPIRINGQALPYKTSITYLGLTLTDKLRLNKHFTNIHNRINRPINTIKYLSFKKGHCDPNILLTLYKTLVRPIMTFAAPFLLQLTHTQLTKLKSTERKTIRYCLNIARTTSNALTYILANLDNIEQHIHTLTKNYYFRTLNKSNYRHIFQNPHPCTLAHKIKTISNCTTLRSISKTKPN